VTENLRKSKKEIPLQEVTFRKPHYISCMKLRVVSVLKLVDRRNVVNMQRYTDFSKTRSNHASLWPKRLTNNARRTSQYLGTSFNISQCIYVVFRCCQLDTLIVTHC